MWRSLLIVLLAAALGALAATFGLSLVAGGTGATDPSRFIFGFAAGTMIFTIPGTIMLTGLDAILTEHGLRNAHRAALAALTGALSGAGVLAFIAPPMAGVGAFYGLATATAFVCLQRLIRHTDEPRS